MTYDYRVIKKTYDQSNRNPRNIEVSYEIKETYYDEYGNITAWSTIPNGPSVSLFIKEDNEETARTELKNILHLMLKAVEEFPILEEKNLFNKEKK